MTQIKAELIDHMGDDLRVVNAARVSFDKESEWLPSGSLNDYEEVVYQSIKGRSVNLSKRDAKLIRYLATHGHWTPFAHPQITLRETVPIFVARQRFKHMVGFVYNETSRRYVDDTPEFYMPDEWREAPVNAKQGSGGRHHQSSSWTMDAEEVNRTSLELYEWMIREGVAPEQARMVLPQSMMTSYYVTGSLAAFARAYNERIDPNAQKEIQLLAQEWDRTIRPLFPVSWDALTRKENQ